MKYEELLCYERIEQFMFRKRFLTETLFDILKINMALLRKILHPLINACVNILSCLTACQLKEKKPALKVYSNPLIQN